MFALQRARGGGVGYDENLVIFLDQAGGGLDDADMRLHAGNDSLLAAKGAERLAKGLEKLGTIFGGYSEWGQPVHEVGRDQKILGLPKRRPNTEFAFRMLCRHNKYVQNFGEVRDDDEISRRERVWIHFIIDLEGLTGGPVGAMPAAEFRRAVDDMLDLDRFEPKTRPAVP